MMERERHGRVFTCVLKRESMQHGGYYISTKLFYEFVRQKVGNYYIVYLR